MRIEEEPITRNEMAYSFCEPDKTTSWEVLLIDGAQVFIRYKDYKSLLDAELILMERRIGK
jgi:hypothetical protein